MEELHNKNTNLVRDIIIGMSDGLTVPFALTTGRPLLTGTIKVAVTGIVAAAFLLAKAVS